MLSRLIRSFLRKPVQGPAAYHDLGRTLVRQGRWDEGVQALRLAVEMEPGNAGYRLELGFALANANAPAECLPHLREALRLRPDLLEIEANLHKPLLDLCAWDEVEASIRRLMQRVKTSPRESWVRGILPYPSLFLALPSEIRRQAALHFARRLERDASSVRRSQSHAGKMRVGYLSADLRNHATAHLAAGLFEHHDRRRFELFAYSLSPDDGSAYRKRVAAAFEHFVDAHPLSAGDLARRIAADGIHLLVDLNGYCKGGRPEALALRPAPLQVNFLGYPGSMQATFVDYVVADRSVLPESDRGSFSEAVAWMPATYQPNDDRQDIASVAPSRAECGLPAAGIVYCCFCHPSKIERAIFQAWMRILQAVPGSVLWLYSAYPEANAALVAAAARAGIDASRLVFAPTRPKTEHLARQRNADLFLDTHTYGAHTTASDALWTGVPVLTWPGDSFAGRVSASLLRAIELPELIVSSVKDYERMAVELAQDRERLQALRAKLASNRAATPLFGTAEYTRHLESAFERMLERHRQGLAPESFTVG